RLRVKWTSPVYAFYHPDPIIEYVNGRRTHLFRCMAKGCKKTCRRFLDKGNRSLTNNLRRHVRKCWGPEVLKRAEEALNVEEARKLVTGVLQDGDISVVFRRKKGAVLYSHRTHTRSETRIEIVRWVTESMRPFLIVKDRGFLSLMKTGRPGYWVPSPTTVARNIKQVYTRTRARIRHLLREYDGRLSFTTDAWTSPNH
ncbi:uncharacterized protein TRAVEDRAFT_76646, partial [Trametes versicolor FP-101664 SS1]|uniref:uncharacterized protein n=1 Tax=Trametes versicolor (strain FP-101664) TaxID=717944 RepID=UPI000462487A